MRHLGLAFFLISAVPLAAMAQGLGAPPSWGGSLPPMGGFGGPSQSAPTTQPASQAPPAGSSNPWPGSPFPAPAPDAQPVRQNYADELTDFHVPPQSAMQENIGSETPMSIPGGHLITTAEVQQTQGMQVLLIDVLAAPPHPTIPGAQSWAGAGNYGSFNDQIQQNLWKALSTATQMNPSYPIIFFCAGARCWESYNAALSRCEYGIQDGTLVSRRPRELASRRVADDWSCPISNPKVIRAAAGTDHWIQPIVKGLLELLFPGRSVFYERRLDRFRFVVCAMVASLPYCRLPADERPRQQL